MKTTLCLASAFLALTAYGHHPHPTITVMPVGTVAPVFNAENFKNVIQSDKCTPELNRNAHNGCTPEKLHQAMNQKEVDCQIGGISKGKNPLCGGNTL